MTVPMLLPRALGTVMVTALVAGCSGGADKTAAEDGVRQFHDRYNAQQYHEIYADTAPEFRGATTEADLVTLLQNLRKRAGDLRTTNQTQWTINAGTGGSSVSLVYASAFEQISATERFLWQINAGKAVLAGYRIETPTLGSP